MSQIAGMYEVGKFLSTLSLRRATQRQIEFERYSDISIHALLAESDTVAGSCRKGVIGFLSTLSLRRATRMAALTTFPA